VAFYKKHGKEAYTDDQVVLRTNSEGSAEDEQSILELQTQGLE
jgi:hypothetical protein